MAKLIKNSFGNFLVILVIFSLVAGWLFSGWPRIWPRSINPDGFNYRVNKIRIPPENSGDDLSTILLLTVIFAFAIFKVVNPPRAYFGRCGVFIFGKNIGKIAL